MSVAGAGIFQKISTLELNGGYPATSKNWQEPVDLKIRGGMQVRKTLLVKGNIENSQNFEIVGDLSSPKIFAGNISPKLTNIDVLGNLCGNINVFGNSVSKNLKCLGKFICDGKIKRYGWLGHEIANSLKTSQIYIQNDKHIIFENNFKNTLQLKPERSVQFGDTNAIGKCSFSFGINSKAIGESSHCEGMNCKSIGIASHCENTNNETIGNYSHAEGTSNNSKADISYSQGKSCLTDGYCSHVEGQLSITTGKQSHVEGFHCKSESNNDYLEGLDNYSNTFEGINHISGQNNITIGNGGTNHIHGESNFCNGLACHIEGSECVAENRYVHVGGKHARANQYGQWVRSAGKIKNIGDAQSSMLHLRTEIIGKTFGYLMLNFPELPALFPHIHDNECWFFELQLIGKDTVTLDHFAQKIEGLITKNKVKYETIHTFYSGSLSSVNLNITLNQNNVMIKVISHSDEITIWNATMLITQVACD